ncbi:MAG TPA: hypothetical protein VFH72_03055 [Candidatus Baltobacteraceae bacterium]|nr:hypothetical protein [Candidatus Baltobacteraceae bacterium]
MISRFRLSIVALCIAGMLAGCGSVTNGLAFQAPAGWSGTPAMFGRFQAWVKTGKDKSSTQMVMLVKGDANKTKPDFAIVPSEYSKDTHVISHGSTKLCGTQPAEQFIAEGTSKDGPSRIEMISTVVGTDRYTAMYIRPAKMAPDKMAEAAIHSLCPLKQ